MQNEQTGVGVRHPAGAGNGHPAGQRFRQGLLLLLGGLVAGGQLTAQNQAWFERQSDWNGFDRFHFKVAGHEACVVVPARAAPGKPWIWRARFPDYHAEMDIQLLGKGFHIGYVDVAGLYGNPAAVSIGNRFYERITSQLGLSPTPALEGVSRGGLFVYNWAAENTDRVACIYCDTPVCDIRSWPGGKGSGAGSPESWQQCLAAWGLSEETASSFAGNPIDHAAAIAAAGIPLLHIVSDNDRIVPPDENTFLLQQRLEKFGHAMQVIRVAAGTEESGGHHFQHPDPQRVVEFIQSHSQFAARTSLLRDGRRILFLGDSITYSGQYVADFESWWLTTGHHGSAPVFMNAGLPSETVSGLSEAGHAGGAFPRPDLAERLARVLEVTHPDLVFACYGINCGIYQPLDDDRFQRYQAGIRNLKRQVEAAGATLVLLTPAFFDDQQSLQAFSYDAVMQHYADWLLEQQSGGWWVIDVHGAMAGDVAACRKTRPDFTFQQDAVHPDAAGHWSMARAMIHWFGDDASADAGSAEAMLSAKGLPGAFLEKVTARLSLRRDAYLSAAGHQRPGIAGGLPVEEAEREAERLTRQILELQDPHSDSNNEPEATRSRSNR
jgi:sialidase-1